MPQRKPSGKRAASISDAGIAPAIFSSGGVGCGVIGAALTLVERFARRAALAAEREDLTKFRRSIGPGFSVDGHVITARNVSQTFYFGCGVRSGPRVGGGAVDRRHGSSHGTQVCGKLAAM